MARRKSTKKEAVAAEVKESNVEEKNVTEETTELKVEAQAVEVQAPEVELSNDIQGAPDLTNDDGDDLQVPPEVIDPPSEVETGADGLEVTKEEVVPSAPKGLEDIFNAMTNYASSMGKHIAPGEEVIKRSQRALANAVMSQFTRDNALERVAFVVDFMKNDTSDAFRPDKLMRGVGRRDVLKSEELTREWSTVSQALSTLAFSDSSYFSAERVGSYCLVERRDAVVNVLSTMAGTTTE